MPKRRCSFPGCRRRLNLADLEQGKCRCGGCFCREHRLPEIHGGDHAWEASATGLGGGVPPKVAKIDTQMS